MKTTISKSNEKPRAYKVIADNKKAYHDYFIIETVEAGIVLTGTEIKSIREGKVNLKDSYIRVHRGVLELIKADIAQYSHGNIHNHEPKRDRKLLVHKKQILKLEQQIKREGLTLVPTKMYWSGSLVKVEVGVAKGTKMHDKRDVISKKEAQRDIDRVLKHRR